MTHSDEADPSGANRSPAIRDFIPSASEVAPAERSVGRFVARVLSDVAYAGPRDLGGHLRSSADFYFFRRAATDFTHASSLAMSSASSSGAGTGSLAARAWS